MKAELQSISGNFYGIQKTLAWIASQIEQKKKSARKWRVFERRVAIYSEKMDKMYRCIDEILGSYRSDGFVHTINRDKDSWAISAMPFDISSVVRSMNPTPTFRTCLLTSATLYAR